MRDTERINPVLGSVAIDNIKFDLSSRDEMPQLLAGIQHLYITPETHEAISEILENGIKKSDKGRKGMELWNILILSMVHANLNIDYDKLKDYADNHILLRKMLGHSLWLDEQDKIVYPLQTIRDNIKLITPEMSEKISKIVIEAGHKFLGIDNESLKVKCDSAVCKVDAHFPTDINLLWDGMRKSITLASQLCDSFDRTDLRQYVHNLNILHNKFYATCQKRCKADKDGKFDDKTINIYDDYLSKCELEIDKVIDVLDSICNTVCLDELSKKHQLIYQIMGFINDAEYHIGLIVRRIFGGEKIPHSDKIFSLFQRHTEWISKGKAGVKQELGIRVAIVSDQKGFILKHRIMQNETDDKIAVQIIKDTKERFANISSCSFDKGFWSPNNRAELEKELDVVAIKKKGYSSKENYAYEHSPEFIEAKTGHSAVESNFNALQNHGLDKCPYNGIDGYKRYIGSVILGRNTQILGKLLIDKEKEKQLRSEKIKAGLLRKVS